MRGHEIGRNNIYRIIGKLIDVRLCLQKIGVRSFLTSMESQRQWHNMHVLQAFVLLLSGSLQKKLPLEIKSKCYIEKERICSIPRIWNGVPCWSVLILFRWSRIQTASVTPAPSPRPPLQYALYDLPPKWRIARRQNSRETRVTPSIS